MKSKTLVIILVFISTAFSSILANKTLTSTKAPETVKKGEEVTIIVNVNHSGNSKSHYTDWVSLKINGTEVERWEYDKKNLPSDENFIIEYKIIAEEDLVIETEGNCNLHGSKGIDRITVKVI